MTREATVLVVDDDNFMRELLQRVFRNAGIAVQTFASAQSLLASPELHPPAVLLLDVKMPGMSGPELQAELHQRGVDLPVVFLTGSSDVPMAVKAMQDGAVDFLEKPFDTQVLVARIRNVLERVARPAPSRPSPGPDHERRMLSLTPRERQVFDSMILGKTSKLIARELGGSFRTIEIHRTRVMDKMGAGSLADLVRRTFSPGGTD